MRAGGLATAGLTLIALGPVGWTCPSCAQGALQSVVNTVQGVPIIGPIIGGWHTLLWRSRVWVCQSVAAARFRSRLCAAGSPT